MRSYIGSLTTVCRSDVCYQPLRPTAYASELQTVVNEPIPQR